MILKPPKKRNIMKNYIDSQILVKYVLRMHKSYSSFFYFTLESHENIAFYSTLDSSVGQVHRDIVVHCTPELEPEVINLIKYCSKDTEIEVLEYSTFKDL